MCDNINRIMSVRELASEDPIFIAKVIHCGSDTGLNFFRPGDTNPFYPEIRHKTFAIVCPDTKEVKAILKECSCIGQQNLESNVDYLVFDTKAKPPTTISKTINDDTLVWINPS